MNIGKITRKQVISLGAALLIGIGVFDAFTIVHQNETGIKYRLGKVVKVDGESALRPGLHWKVPAIDRIKRIASYEVPVTVSGLAPVASDGLMMQELEFSFYYQLNPNALDALMNRYGPDEHSKNHGNVELVKNYISESAKNVAERVVKRRSSTWIFANRIELGDQLGEEIQTMINLNNPLPEPYQDQAAVVINRVAVSKALVHSAIDGVLRKRIEDAVLKLVEQE